jgi:hypothetical protein
LTFKLSIDFSRASKLLGQMRGNEARRAKAEALNDAFFEARRVLQQQLRERFDAPTPYITKSVQVIRRASVERLEAELGLGYLGGKGVEPWKVLGAQIFGGKRRVKRHEVALQRAGILPRGYVTVPSKACRLDRYGNVPASFIVQLLSYFKAFGEQGYRANMTDKRKTKLANTSVSPAGVRKTNGVRYFVASGRLRSGRTGHLAAGIWAARGTQDVDVQPVLLFVPVPSYKARLDFFGEPIKAAQAKFNPRLRYRLRNIIEGRGG